MALVIVDGADEAEVVIAGVDEEAVDATDDGVAAACVAPRVFVIVEDAFNVPVGAAEALACCVE